MFTSAEETYYVIFILQVFDIFFFKYNGTFINKLLNQLSKGMCWLSLEGGWRIIGEKVTWWRISGNARFSSTLKSHILNWTLKPGMQVARYGVTSHIKNESLKINLIIRITSSQWQIRQYGWNKRLRRERIKIMHQSAC